MARETAHQRGVRIQTEAWRPIIEKLEERLAAALAKTEAARTPLPDAYPCQRCGRRDGMDAVATPLLWSQLVDGRILGPRGEVGDGKWNILCLWCMDEIAYAKGLGGSVSLHFVGRALTGGSKSDADLDQVSRLVAERDALRSRAEAAEQEKVEREQRLNSAFVNQAPTEEEHAWRVLFSDAMESARKAERRADALAGLVCVGEFNGLPSATLIAAWADGLERDRGYTSELSGWLRKVSMGLAASAPDRGDGGDGS